MNGRNRKHKKRTEEIVDGFSVCTASPVIDKLQYIPNGGDTIYYLGNIRGCG